MHPDEAIARLAEGQFGHVARDQALHCGLTTQQIRYRLDIGRWVSVFRRVYRVGGTPATFEGSVLAAQLAAGERMFAGSFSAARLWGMHPGDDVVHLVTDRDRRVRLDGVIVHRSRLLIARDVTTLGCIPITTPVRTLIDLATRIDEARLEAVLDEALRRGLVSVPALAKRIATVRNGTALRRLVDARRDEGATESALERRFVRIIKAAGLPAPVQQYVVTDASGAFVGRVDFAYPRDRVAIEIDGYAFHSSRERFDADRERDHRLRACGWLPVRFTARHLDDAQGVVQRVNEARSWSRTAD